MDDSTAAGKDPRAGRWVSVDTLVSRAEDGEPLHRYASLSFVPPPDLAKRGRRRVRELRDKTPVDLPPRSRHGTWYAYDKLTCRCDLCTDAARDKQRAVDRRRRAQETAA